MPVKWLLKKITGRSSQGVKHATHQATLDKEGYQLASGEPPLSPELEEAAKRAGALALAVNQSMKAASVDTNPFRKQQSIKAAREALASVLQISAKYPAIKPLGLEDVMTDLERLGRESSQAFAIEQTPPPTSNNPIQETLESSFRVINESIEIATKTKNAETFASRINVAEKTLDNLRTTAEKLGRSVDGISNAKATIEALKRRGPPTKTGKSKRPKKTAAETVPNLPKPEAMRPPELDISPWMHVPPADTGIYSAEVWTGLRDDLRSGNFWADRAKEARDDPIKRLQIGLENLPLPGAFEECAIATRAIIRATKKAKEPLERPLSLLYWLAALHSFTVPYSKRLGAPGHIAMEMASGAEVSALPFTYNNLGYEHLVLLKVTDVKAMVAIWGEPNSHSTLHDLYQNFWLECENRAADHYERKLLD